MGIEEEIALRLNEGSTPADLISQGYRKSTVYKVASRDQTNMDVVPALQWRVQLSPDPASTYVLPGQTITFTPTIRNTGLTPLLVTRWGMMPKWLVASNQWYYNDEEAIVAPSQSRRLQRISIPVPAGLPLDEYEMLFGVTATVIDPTTRTTLPTATIWATPPFLLKAQRRPTGRAVFLSHSVADLALVRPIARHLENNGIEAIIAEDAPQPGALLDVTPQGKFGRDIDRSSIVLVLLTHEAMHSEWVNKEIEYALAKQKPLLVLKEQGLDIRWNVEYVEFSKTESQPQLTARVFEYISRKFQDDAGLKFLLGVLAVAVVFALGMMVGAAIVASRSPTDEQART